MDIAVFGTPRQMPPFMRAEINYAGVPLHVSKGDK